MSRLLLIEDDPDSLAMTTMLLEHYGFEVVGVARATEARTELARGGFDIVLADLMVASADLTRCWEDLDVLVRLAGPTPVGVVSAWPVKPDQLVDHGLAFAVLKPYRAELVLARIAAAVPAAPVSEAHQARIVAYVGCIQRGDWDGLAGCCTEDVVYHLPSDDPAFGRLVRGRAALRALAAETFQAFVEPRFTIESIRSLPRGAVARYQGSWSAPDGTRSSLPGALLFVFDGDLIAEIGVRLDVPALHAVLAS